MNRKQRRAAGIKEHPKTRTYTFTDKQLEAYINEAIEKTLKKHDEKLVTDSINTTLALLLILPLEVLMDHYWQKSYEKRIPEFTNYVLEYYRAWQDGELDMDKMKEDLWEYGHVRLEADQNG